MHNFNSKSKIDIKKRSFAYALDLIRLIGQLDNRDLSVQVIARQLLRSGTSVGANIIEAQASSSKREFTNFISYSLKSANESKFWLALLRESSKGEREVVDGLLSETKELANILASSILTLKGKRKP
jgi:four helix bundle protein